MSGDAFMENYSYREFEIAIDEANGTFTVDFQGAEYVERWNTYIVKENLSNVPDVIAAMADSIVPGVNRILFISYYDEEQEYTPEWDNYNMRK